MNGGIRAFNRVFWDWNLGVAWENEWFSLLLIVSSGIETRLRAGKNLLMDKSSDG